jgi:hypothetical protein
MKKKDNRIYIHKEDVWAEGNHWMTSASRDIYEHFYKAIRNTFIDRYKDPQLLEVAEQILHLREWFNHNYGLINVASKTKSMPELTEYKVNRKAMPDEIEYFRNEDRTHKQTENDFDPIIYPDFDSFFNKANHGYGTSEKSKRIIFDLYQLFMKQYSVGSLKLQLETEYKEKSQFLHDMLNDLKLFNGQSEYDKFHKFIMKDFKKTTAKKK